MLCHIFLKKKKKPQKGLLRARMIEADVRNLMRFVVGGFLGVHMSDVADFREEKVEKAEWWIGSNSIASLITDCV
jgi:hypothetical protein